MEIVAIINGKKMKSIKFDDLNQFKSYLVDYFYPTYTEILEGVYDNLEKINKLIDGASEYKMVFHEIKKEIK